MTSEGSLRFCGGESQREGWIYKHERFSEPSDVSADFNVVGIEVFLGPQIKVLFVFNFISLWIQQQQSHRFLSAPTNRKRKWGFLLILRIEIWVLLISGAPSYLVEAQEVLDARGRVENVALGCHHQHEAVQGLKTEGRRWLGFPRFHTVGGAEVYLKQQVSLREADSTDGDGLGAAGGGWQHRCRGGPEHDAALAVPAGAVLAFLHGGCRRGNISAWMMVSSAVYCCFRPKKKTVFTFLNVKFSGFFNAASSPTIKASSWKSVLDHEPWLLQWKHLSSVSQISHFFYSQIFLKTGISLYTEL